MREIEAIVTVCRRPEHDPLRVDSVLRRVKAVDFVRNGQQYSHEPARHQRFPQLDQVWADVLYHEKEPHIGDDRELQEGRSHSEL